jgi:hypothetical protein
MQWGLRKCDRGSRTRGRDLIRECEVYLSGHYAEYLETRNENVPNWAWLNVLAHGGPEQLRSLVHENSLYGRGGMRTSVWWQAVAFLAGEILSQQDDDGGLDELRRSVLVPLELNGLAEGCPPQRPGDLVRTVLDALDQHPSSWRR